MVYLALGGVTMITIKENTTLVGVSELRQGIEKILKKIKKGHVVIEKRHKPKAVLMSNEEYEAMQSLVETAEDVVLGFVAQQRAVSGKSKDYVDIESLLR